ncbi:hypothetical protein L7F22_063779 [Adiantum nelumboides]|nr:hypothetical protein [Adiantum nelumboides]
MFSSLEALDAEDNLHAAPVARQGAFQPKVKPRARKGGAGPARPPFPGPAFKTKSLPPSALNNEQENYVARLQEEAETVTRNLESQSTGITPEVFNKVGIETGPTYNSGLADASCINSAEVTEVPDRNIYIHFNAAAIESLAASTVREPIAPDEGSGLPVSGIVETQESAAVPLQALAEQDAFGCLSTLSEENRIKPPIEVSDAPSAFDQLLASHAFLPEPAVEHVIEVGAPSEKLTDGTEYLPFSAAFEATGALRKKKRPCKDRQDNIPVVANQGGLTLAEDASIDDTNATSNSEAKHSKKRRMKMSGANEQQQRVSLERMSNTQKKNKGAKVASLAAPVSAVDATVAEESTQEEVTKSVGEPARKKKKGHKQAREVKDDGKDHPNTSSEGLLAGSVFTCASQSAADVAIDVSRATVGAQDRMKQDAQGNVGEQQEVGDVCTLLGPCKRKRRKPAKFLDGADDDEVISTTTGALEIAKLNRKQESQAGTHQDFEENVALSELFPSLPMKIFKLKESKLASSNATRVGKPVTPTTEENQKKKFRKFVPHRRRVERRAMNPADPDLDPKKMTMKDIIRLAEAKERMLKKDNAKKAKNGDQATVNEPEKEPESYESTCMAPQVQIVDGQIVINEQSLVVNAHPKDDIRSYRRVEETHAKLNYHSYMKRTRTQTWRPDETELFYQALREFGTNFAMIQHLFPGRTRKQVFLKYKKEEKCSPLRISEAMRVKPCDTSHFLEVISSLNLLPSEIPDELESVQASVPVELSSSKKEIGDNSCSPEGGERQMADGAACALKLDEQSVHSKNQGTHDRDNNSACSIETLNLGQPNGHQELITEEATKLNEISKPCESPRKPPSPPRKKKSLFSYQISAAKS